MHSVHRGNIKSSSPLRHLWQWLSTSSTETEEVNWIWEREGWGMDGGSLKCLCSGGWKKLFLMMALPPPRPVRVSLVCVCVALKRSYTHSSCFHCHFCLNRSCADTHFYKTILFFFFSFFHHSRLQLGDCQVVRFVVAAPAAQLAALWLDLYSCFSNPIKVFNSQPLIGSGV